MRTASPTKLRDGSWGARVQGAVQAGDTITIRTAAGKTWDARVTRVVWSGEGVAICATESAAVHARRSSPAPRSMPRAPEPPSEGAHQISRRAGGQNDRHYDVGRTIHAPLVAVTGGGPDGHYYTVLTAHLDPPCDDMGSYGWREYAWVRAATDAEAAPVVARVGARIARTRLREIARVILGAERCDDEPLPAGGSIVEYEPCTPMGPPAVLRVEGEEVRAWHPGHYDDWRQSHGRIMDAALAREVETLAPAVRS